MFTFACVHVHMVVALVLDVEFHVAFPHKVGVLGKHNITISENKILRAYFTLDRKCLASKNSALS